MDRYPDYEAIADYHDAQPPPEPEPGAIAVSAPMFLGREKEYVLDCLERGWLTQGHYVGRLEHEFAKFTGSEFAIACNSGTAALHLALLSIGIAAGDVVLVPALSYIATANAVTYCGATPIFVDVDRQTWCIDPADVKRKCARLEATSGKRPAAAIAVHLFDAVCDMDGLRAALPEEAFIVEDAAQAHGARYGQRAVGSVGHVAAFSFYGSKTIAAGEGGVVTTSNPVTADVARLYRGQGANRAGRYEHSVVGYNYRMPDMSAAVALAQLETFEEHQRRRRKIMGAYRGALPQHIKKIALQTTPPDTEGGSWACGVILPPGAHRDGVAESMAAAGVETRPFFVPIPFTSAYHDEHHGATVQIAAHLAGRGLTLPTHAAMTMTDVGRVIDVLKEALK